MASLRAIYDDYTVLTAQAVDDYGKPLPKRINGFDVTPSREHDLIMGMEAAKAWHMTPDEFVDNLPASEFTRRVALVRASQWSQPTAAEIERSRHKRYTGR